MKNESVMTETRRSLIPRRWGFCTGGQDRVLQLADETANTDLADDDTSSAFLTTKPLFRELMRAGVQESTCQYPEMTIGHGILSANQVSDSATDRR